MGKYFVTGIERKSVIAENSNRRALNLTNKNDQPSIRERGTSIYTCSTHVTRTCEMHNFKANLANMHTTSMEIDSPCVELDTASTIQELTTVWR